MPGRFCPPGHVRARWSMRIPLVAHVLDSHVDPCVHRHTLSLSHARASPFAAPADRARVEKGLNLETYRLPFGFRISHTRAGVLAHRVVSHNRTAGETHSCALYRSRLCRRGPLSRVARRAARCPGRALGRRRPDPRLSGLVSLQHRRHPLARDRALGSPQLLLCWQPTRNSACAMQPQHVL